MRKNWGKRINNKTYQLLNAFTHNYNSKKRNAEKKLPLTATVRYNQELISNFFKIIDQLAEEHLEVSYAGKWIIDNRDTLVEEVKTLRLNINRKMLKLLPYDPNDDISPRISNLFKKFYKQRKKLTEAKLIEYIQQYQVKTPLELDEVFSMPLFLKLVVTDTIVDHLWYVVQDTLARNDVVYLHRTNDVVPEWDDVLRLGEEYSIFFATHLKKHLTKVAHKELIQKANNFYREEQQNFHRCTAIIQGEELGRYMRDLQILREIDWDHVFKEISIVDEILSHDPVGVYPKLDIGSRNAYLDEFKRIGKYISISEVKLAEKIVALAMSGTHEYERHVGYYILDEGRGKVHYKLSRSLTGDNSSFKSSMYLSTIILTVLIGYFWLIWILQLPIISALVIGLFFILPLFDFVKRILNTLLTDFVSPRRLPRLDMHHAIDESTATMFVIPSLLIQRKDIKRLVDSLEIIYLANKADHVYFSLLLDYRDSKQEHELQDKSLFNELKKAINTLNQKYGFTDKFSFYLRNRLWSEKQQVWMGWERKRGKLLEFSNILRGNPTTSPYYLSLKKTPYIKYLITVDEDAVVPKDFISDLVGTLKHPLNKAYYDEDTHMLKRGYVILQPRLNFTFKAKRQSVLSQSLCDARGFDFYSRVLNEIYFDLFAEGHYTGKGIMDIDGFVRELTGRFPDDTILSHDLIEGALCGTGYVSDISIYEGFPSTVKSYFMREHRWIRGNWQIIDWLFRRVRDQLGNIQINQLTTFQKFKVLDNLLVSLLNPIILATLVIIWFLFPEKAYVVYWFILFEFFLLEFLLGFYNIIARHLIRLKFKFIVIDAYYLIKNIAKKNLFAFLFLPYDSYLKMDAIVKALYRKYISKRNTLQWSTFISSENNKTNVGLEYVKIFGIPWCILLVALGTAYSYSRETVALSILLIIWLLMPLWTYVYDRKISHE